MKDIILAAIMSTSPEAMECMAKNIYFESRNQSHLGQLAVAHTTINRVVDDRYPNDICAVVKQGVKNSDGSMKRHRCQFSWYCDGLTDNPKNIDLWYQAQVVAAEAIGLWSTYDVTEGSTHYHTDKVNPSWAKTLDEVVQIDDHIFYRWNQ